MFKEQEFIQIYQFPLNSTIKYKPMILSHGVSNKCNEILRYLHFKISNQAYFNVCSLALTVSEFAVDALVPRDAQNLFASALELTLLGKCGRFAGSVVQITRRGGAALEPVDGPSEC